MSDIDSMNDVESEQCDEDMSLQESAQVFIERSSNRGLGIRVADTASGHGVDIIATEAGSHAEHVFGSTDALLDVQVTHLNDTAVTSRDGFFHLLESNNAIDGGVWLRCQKKRRRTSPSVLHVRTFDHNLHVYFFSWCSF